MFFGIQESRVRLACIRNLAMPAWLLRGYFRESRLLEMLSIAHGDGRFAKTYSSWRKLMYWSWSTDCSNNV